MDERLRRSLLYVPASSEAMLRKAPSRGADAIIVDLEDGVLPDAKEGARARAEGLWLELDLGVAEVLLRVNPPGTPWHEDDLAVAAKLRPAGLVLPKCEDPGAIAAVAARLEGTPLFPMVETARGVLAAPELARAPHAAGLLFGAADFRANVRGSREPDEGEILRRPFAAQAVGASATCRVTSTRRASRRSRNSFITASASQLSSG